MSKTWRIVVLVMLLVAGSFGTVAAQGKPDNPGGGGGGGNGGGPGSGETCPTGTAQVVLDPGHGGGDPGAVDQIYGMREADLNLDIAYQTMGILQDEYGYSVALTRYGDQYLENSQRGAIANACGALVFVEIHLNASGDPSVNFTQTFWGKKNKDLDFSNTMIGSIAWLTGDGRVGQFANGGLLHANMPSTLVEAVFLTNPDEAAALYSGARQPEIASSIADGIIAYLTCCT